MSLLEQVAGFVQHGDRVERAVNPDTGQPYPAPTFGVKLLAWFAKTPWLRRQALKWITAGGAVLSAWLMAHGGGEHEAAIVAGAVAGFTFIYEQFISFLCNKAGIKPPAVDDEPEPPVARSLAAASPFAPVGGFPRPSFFTQPTQPMDHDNEPPTTIIRPQPRGFSRHSPLGVKGCVVIAEPKSDNEGPSDGSEMKVRTQIRGTLRCEADDGGLVILDTPVGIQSLERSKYHFYPRAEE